MTDPKGGVWRYGYDAQGNRISALNPLGHTSRFSYDAAGRLSGQTAPNGLASSYGYDLRGRLLSSTTGNEVTAYNYTPTGQLASAVLPSGYQASYSYDAAQRLTGATDNRGNSVQYTLDAMGNRVREEVKDSSGALALATSRVINNLNRVASLTDAAGQSTVLGYDANGEAISQRDQLGLATSQNLDALRRPTAITFADNTSASLSWSQLSELAQVRDPKGVATQYERNGFGEVMRESSPDIGSISYQRDQAGDVIGQTDAKGNATRISRDALGRPLEVRYSDTNVARFTWDQGGGAASQIGYLSGMQNSSGSTSYERDAHGRVLSKTQRVNDNARSPASFRTAYTYYNGQLQSITYPRGLKVFYRRNASGQIIAIDTQEPGSGAIKPFVGNITHTALGQPKAWAWSNGDFASWAFDANGRMRANEFASYTFDAAGRITGITQNLWSRAGESEDHKDQSKGAGKSAGNGASNHKLYLSPYSFSAGYDNRNRLTSFGQTGAMSSYSYDANSNRLTSIEQAVGAGHDGDHDEFVQTSSQALNIDGTSNRLLGFTQTLAKTKGAAATVSSTSQVNYTLDANGNLTSDGFRTFEYDAANRLSGVKAPSGGDFETTQFLHDAKGQRVFKSEAKDQDYEPKESELGSSYFSWLRLNFSALFGHSQSRAMLGTAYVYGDGPLPDWALLGEYGNGSAKGKGRSEYLWLPTDDQGAIPVGLYRNEQLYAIHTDHLGTPRLITNQENKPVWQWAYSGFGNNRPVGVLQGQPNPDHAASKPALEFDLRFPGQIADAETGQFYNYFRTYQQEQGRYTQNDPIGLAGGWNRFAYVDQDPLNWTDPRGERKLFEICVLLACLLNDKRPPPPPPPRPPIIQPTKNPPDKNC